VIPRFCRHTRALGHCDPCLEECARRVLEEPLIIDDGQFPHEYFADARERLGLPRFYDGTDVWDNYRGPSGPCSFELLDGTIHTPLHLRPNPSRTNNR